MFSKFKEFQCFGKTIRVVMYSDLSYEEFLNEDGKLTPISFYEWALQEKQKLN